MSNRNREYEVGPYEEEYRGFEIRDDETARGPLILALAIGVLIVFAGVVWNTYRQGIRPQDGALPMVTAEAQPYKRVPDDRGGVEIDDLDRRLYDVIDGTSRGPEPTKVSDASQGFLQGGPPQDLRPGTSGDKAAASETAPDVPPAPPVGESAAQDTSKPASPVTRTDLAEQTEAPAEPVQTASVSEAPAQEPAAQPEPASRFAFAPGGQYVVQISALRSEAAAADAWKTARRKNPDIFRGASMSIERADLGAKGVFYRLRAGAFGSRDTASTFCDAYKAEGGDCIVVRDTA
ncbi:SPOR domain-containing protein [Henriciella aquimarina]|uniref:SPOR domain-containing protein n=1 Tax=Henriciella aquimarina TaxID=545261 RepID=UPI001301A0EA|nr:SPOR domain-containing protein [Henriciella aquimarina]